ncbi:uncharacterized protein LOC131211900 [Anopheles bellator]|uniref:uncharacterized protein LOC131211900 n=1 Tax=Anopheles bellator TaxID=139047 RepID=UPI0026479494|nr:uncharacterized protein LOC131211900 [Anopheles bellator]
MASADTLARIRHEIVDATLRFNAITNDIKEFHGTLKELEVLNEEGRKKLGALQQCIAKLDEYAEVHADAPLLREATEHRSMVHRAMLDFRRTNVIKMREIESDNREELFMLSPHENEVRARSTSSRGRAKGNESGLLMMQQEQITQRMLTITQQLNDATQKSASSLDVLHATSATVNSTRDELLKAAGNIQKSAWLLDKLNRRNCTDKVLFGLGLTLFLVVVLYIFMRRLFA